MPNLSTDELKLFTRLQFVRSVTIFLVFLTLASIIDLGTSPQLLALVALLGSIRGGRLAKSYRSLAFGAAEVGATAIGVLLLRVLAFYLAKSTGLLAESSMVGVLVRDTLLVLLIFYSGALLSTLSFWRHSAYLTFELVIIALFFAVILSGHRNYHLDAPKEFADLAWKLGIEAQQFLLSFGVFLSILLGIYLALATARPILGAVQIVRTSGRLKKISALLFPIALLAIFLVYAQYVNNRYGDNLSRASEGVGENSEEGQSPLGFHSAVGKTKQPAALVRLEGDYSNNPWTPMLYLRESALSTFNGKELVLAPKDFDSETPRTAPGQPYISLEQEPGPYREKLSHSVFLLAKHKTSVGIDYPQSIRAIKNPDSNRFVATYQVQSFAPAVKVDSLIGENVGDPKWDSATWNHYLRAPGDQDKSPALPEDLHLAVPDSHLEDLRYRALAKKLVVDVEAPVEKAKAILDYLSANSIYTRQPGHQVTEGGDPVAPYLFADEKRGYCVHFAHAAVYLLRLAGIPARIGTGYLTDLNYAKGGHILLNMGDRHAWPEIYIQGYGWAIVDIQPAKAENEQVLPPDEKLLEELMSKLDELGELTPPGDPEEDSKQQNNFDDQLITALTSQRTWTSILVLLFFFFLTVKLYLRYSYVLTSEPKERARRAYRSYATTQTDLGNPRDFGETHIEYSRRVDARARELAVLTDEANYNSNFSSTTEKIDESLEESLSGYRSWRGVLKKCLAFISPFSILRWGRW